MSNIIKDWQDFNNSIFTDQYPAGNGEIQGIIWQNPNGVWIAIFGDPLTPGRYMTVQVDYNPWTGEKLSTKI